MDIKHIPLWLLVYITIGASFGISNMVLSIIAGTIEMLHARMVKKQ